MPTAHPSGWAHADGALRSNRPGGPHWLREPADPNALVDHLWSRTATKTDGVLAVGGVLLRDRQLSPHLTVTVGTVVLAAAIPLAGPVGASLIGAISYLLDIRARTWRARLFNSSMTA